MIEIRAYARLFSLKSEVEKTTRFKMCNLEEACLGFRFILHRETNSKRFEVTALVTSL